MPVIYCIERSNHLDRIAEIETACCEFWDNHILTNIPPDDCGPSMDTVNRVRVPRNTVATIEIPDELLEQSKAISAQQSAIKKQYEEVNAKIKGLMIGFAKAMTPKGHFATLMPINNKGHTVEPYSYDRLTITLRK